MTEQLLSYQQREREERYNAFNKTANSRKRVLYWIGFLDGALSSGHIEAGEGDALMAEATKFAEFFNDPDASDLVEDIRAECFSDEEDFISGLQQIIEDKRAELKSGGTSQETDELNEFLGFCAGVICDGMVLDREIRALMTRFKSSAILMRAPAFSSLRQAVESTLDDNVVAQEEAEEVQEWIAHLVGDGFVDTGIPNIGSVAQLDEPIRDPDKVIFEGSIFVLTGPMRIGTRAFIIKEIERLGGSCKNYTTNDTDYVVVSALASRHWRTTHFGTKIERARELIDRGQKLRFVSELALEKAFQKVSS